jgi:hypothetical protein
MGSTYILLSSIAFTGCHSRDSTENYKDRLIGTWRVNSTVGSAAADGTTRYLADGTTISSAKISRESRIYQLEVVGKWSLGGNRITYVVEKSNLPDLLPVGTRTFDDIIELTDSTLIYRTQRGVLVTMQKAE